MKAWFYALYHFPSSKDQENKHEFRHELGYLCMARDGSVGKVLPHKCEDLSSISRTTRVLERKQDVVTISFNPNIGKTKTNGSLWTSG